MQPHRIKIQEESDLRKFTDLFLRNRVLFISTMIITLIAAAFINRYSVPVYDISASILIREHQSDQTSGDGNDYLNSSLVSGNQNFQNELWVIKSSPVIDQTIRNLNLEVTYYKRDWIKRVDSYGKVPFRIIMLPNHPQPLNTTFRITFLKDDYFQLQVMPQKKTAFYNFETDRVSHEKGNWFFIKSGKFGDLIETPDLAFVVKQDTSGNIRNYISETYEFDFNTVAAIREGIKKNLEFKVAERMSTVIEIKLKSHSSLKGIDIVNEIMNVYSEQNLRRKNHIASITIDYIEKQLDEITDSLNRTEESLQRFRSSNQLLNITDQANGISAQYINLQDQLAELVSRKRYYDYVSEYLSKNKNFSEMMLPAALGIQDQFLNNLMTELVTSQAQRSNLIENNQERNPLVQKLGIQIENLKKTISDNITALGKTTNISIDEMSRRVSKIEGEISRMPVTQRKLGSIERKYRLNDAIYSYLMEKHAEAKITKASNLPDDMIIEPADTAGLMPVSPNKKVNFLIACFLGLVIPLGYLTLRSAINNCIETQDEIERLTNRPVLGKILHNPYKIRPVMYEFPKSTVAESFRALRTNLDFYVRGGQKKVIMVTSCLQGEGKTFISINLAMSYAQLGRKTVLVNFDLRKPESYFNENGTPQDGLTSYMINQASVEDIIVHSKYHNLDYIVAGVIPPNPVELIALDKTNYLISRLKEMYDVIVLDTTPLAQVTDAYLLIGHSELTVVAARQNYSMKSVFSVIMKDLQLKKVENVCVVMNDNKIYRDQYGYGIGYNGKGTARKSKEDGSKKESIRVGELISVASGN
jgi:capsular exopolysaccharide synthesis family protein